MPIFGPPQPSQIERLFAMVLADHRLDNAKLDFISNQLRQIMAKLDDLETEVGEMETVVESAIVLIKGLRDEIVAAGTDQAKLAALVGRLDAKGQALAEAVAANTPGDTDPTEDETTPAPE
jgi:outer membrane murein-binding lipoprotein Lpp